MRPLQRVTHVTLLPRVPCVPLSLSVPCQAPATWPWVPIIAFTTQRVFSMLHASHLSQRRAPLAGYRTLAKKLLECDRELYLLEPRQLDEMSTELSRFMWVTRTLLPNPDP